MLLEELSVSAEQVSRCLRQNGIVMIVFLVAAAEVAVEEKVEKVTAEEVYLFP